MLTNVLSGRLGYVNPAWSLINFFPRDERERAMAALERVGLTGKERNRADARLIFERFHNVGDVMIHINPSEEKHEDLIRL